MSQNQEIKKHLLSGKSLTSRQAQSLFNCDRLAARINNLRNSGMDIKTTKIEKNGKQFAKYHL